MGKPRVDCMDGDPTCDADGKVDGQCTFSITVCAAVADPALPKCTPPPSVVFTKNTANLPTPSGPGCAATAGTVVVPVKHGKKKDKPRTQKIVLIAVGPSKPKVDRNTVFLRCIPSSGTTTTTLPSLCQPNSAGGPRELDFVTAATGSDLDNGTTGTSHNFPIPQNSTLKYCLSGCDGAGTPSCQASGSTGKGSLNGEDFGAPLPLFASNVPVCVVNRFADPTITGTVNVQTGIFDATATPIHLNSDVYLTNQPPQDVCPICSGGSVGAKGTCDSGPNQGKSCTVDGIVTVNNPPAVTNKKYTLSSDCPPDPAQLKATLKITLPLTGDPAKPSTLAAKAAGNFPCPGQTVHDSCGSPCTVDCSTIKPLKGGLNQFCCNSDGTTPCFPTSPSSGSQAIVRTGSATPPTPAWVPNSTTSATSTGVLAATFCEAATGSNVIDTTSGLPGPGALLLNGTATFVGNQ
ncbi:MAG TPA: hypothetical protein VKW76_09470 [Candidatus Binatia bacterium]|nr:hypothetical protein [Candidatus Binatia bacterium]